jgi:hypothetical protein
MAYSEPYEALDEKTREISRAITSLREELEAIDWYNQRVATSKDQSLKEVMAHHGSAASNRRQWGVIF